MILLLVFQISVRPYGCYCWLTVLLWICFGQLDNWTLDIGHWPWTSWKYGCCGTSCGMHLAIECCKLASGTYFEEWKLWVPITSIHRLTISSEKAAIRLLWMKAYTMQYLRNSLVVKFTNLYCTSWVLAREVRWHLNVVYLDNLVRVSELTTHSERILDSKLVLRHFYEKKPSK